MKRLELSGLNGHHPLGFLAACGVTRSYRMVDGEARLAWKQLDDRSGWIAVLHGGNDLTLDKLIQTIIRQADQQGDMEAINWSSKIDDRRRFRELAFSLITSEPCERNSESLSLLPALASDLVTNDEGKLQPTYLDLTSGNQGFLKSIWTLSRELSKKSESSTSTAAFREALCGPWRYRDSAHSLGWDPLTQRLHALRNRLPEKDKLNRSVRGAVFLASRALPMFPCFAVKGKLRTVGFHRYHGADWFVWPIWREPISLETLRSLLSHPITGDLMRRGVQILYGCRRMRTGGAEGNYQVFSNAEEFILGNG